MSTADPLDTAHRRPWESRLARAHERGAAWAFRQGAASAGVVTLDVAAPWEVDAFDAVRLAQADGIDVHQVGAHLADPGVNPAPVDPLGRTIDSVRDAHGQPVDIAPLVTAHDRVLALREAAPKGTAG